MRRALAVMMLLASQVLSVSVNATSIAIETSAAREVVETDDYGHAVNRLVPVDSAAPGEEIVYTITYTNTGSDSWDHVVITDPLPAGVLYIPGSVTGAFTDFAVSVDGGKTYSTPDEARAVDEFGYERAARPEDYTHLRWVAESLAPGDSGFVRYRSRLE